MAYCKYSPSDMASNAGSSPQSSRTMSQSRAMVLPFTQSSFFSLALVELISLLSLVVVPVISIVSLGLLLTILA